ncbi:MAG: AI-2E family transporter [Lutibacter sp.]|jgi:predicted PurR-regulated permease PerM|nr:AI-2E family transporter [Lutibacter sp.]
MLNSKTIATGILRAIGVLVLATISLYFLDLFQSILIYLVVALILTLIGNPILDFFKNRLKFKHTLATIATLLIFILCIAGFVMMFTPLISSQGENLSLQKTAEIEKNIT